MSSDGSDSPTDFDQRQRKADDERIRAYLANTSATTRLCCLYAPTPEMLFLPSMRAADAITTANAFFDMRREFHKQFGKVAKSATTVLILDDEALRRATYSADHIVDIKHLRRDIEPLVIRLGEHPYSEVGVYLEKYRTICLPSLPSDNDWSRATQQLRTLVFTPTR